MALSCVNSVPPSFLPADSPHCRCLVSSCCHSSCSAGQYNSDSAWLNLFALPQVTLPVLTSAQSSWRQLLCWTRPDRDKVGCSLQVGDISEPATNYWRRERTRCQERIGPLPSLTDSQCFSINCSFFTFMEVSVFRRWCWY